MAPCSKTREFFLTAPYAAFDKVLTLYDQVLKLKAEAKSSKPHNVIKLDQWYQNELPKKIKSRGKDAHLTHEELVQTIKWKLARGKFRPNLTNLVQMNTPRVVMQETKKALRKALTKSDLQASIQAMCNLKGVGPAFASAVIAAGAPHLAPFMADECLWAMPECDSLDYTMKEYMKYVEMVNQCVERLTEQGGEFTPHKVELAVWTYYIANDLKPELLEEVDACKNAAPATKAPVDAPAEATEAAPEAAEATPAENKDNDKEEESSNGKTEEETKEESSSPKNGHNNEDSNMSAPEEEAKKPEEEPAKAAEEEAAEKPKEEEKKEQESTNGAASNGNGKAPEEATTNGKSEETAAATNGVDKVASAVPSAVAEAETDTNDSTKENQEESKQQQPAQKRPAAAESAEAAEAEEPSAKKAKSAEAPAAPEVASA